MVAQRSVQFRFTADLITTERFDTAASRYHQGVYKRKRIDLITALDSVLSPLFLGQLKNLHKAALSGLKTDIQTGLKAADYNFATVLSGARERAEQLFVDDAKEAVVVEGDAAWAWEDELELLRQEIRAVGDQLRKDETKKMVNTIEVSPQFLLKSAFRSQMHSAPSGSRSRSLSNLL